MIVSQGAQLRNIYFIRRGDVMIEHTDKKGEFFDVAVIGQGSFYGEY